MDLIYMNAEKADIGVMRDHTLDLAFGSDENDFECKIVRSNHCCEEGFFLYYEGTEYGGIIDDIEFDTESDEVTYHGRTWHGIMDSKILEPDAGEDHLIVSGEANGVLGTLIARMELSDMFVASTEASGINISNYKMNRYIAGYEGIRKMLRMSGAKLNIVFKNGFVELSAKPIVDYSKDEQFDKDQIAFTVNQKGHPINHVICLGKGDLAEREVIHVYADKYGNISQTKVFTGIAEVVSVYENTNAENSEELKQGGIDIIKEAWASDEVDVTFDFEDENFDIGDIVGANDTEIGVSVRMEITKKIVSIKNGEATISYPSDNKNTTKSTSSSGGGSGGKGEKGDKGDSGVYVGSGEMPEGYNVQIDPSGEIEEYVLKSVYDAKVAEIDSAISEQNKNLGGLRFGVDGDGNGGYYKADDSFVPFSRGILLFDNWGINTTNNTIYFDISEYTECTYNCIESKASEASFGFSTNTATVLYKIGTSTGKFTVDISEYSYLIIDYGYSETAKFSELSFK